MAPPGDGFDAGGENVGGSPGTGGAPATGAAPGSGGRLATGGASSTGGGGGSGGTATGGAATGGNGTGGGATGGAPGGTPNVIFVTSTTYTLIELANKGGGGTDAAAVLAGADAACAQVAKGPGSLAPAGKYVAWMSSAQANARDRLKAAAGGVAPRGWVRIDGRPFLDELPAPGHISEVRYPVGLNEKGQVADARPWVGTDSSGMFTPDRSCDNWTNRTSSTSYASAGLAFAGAHAWSATEFVNACNDQQELYCLQVDHVASVPRPTPPPNAKRIFMALFMTPAAGLASADARCQAEAAHGGLTGTYRALLAPTGASAASRFHADGTRPFVRPDGVIVAATDTDLLSSGTHLMAPPCVDARGMQYYGIVFSGAPSVTATADLNCGNWSSVDPASPGRFSGGAVSGIRLFLNNFTDACTRGDSIFCLED